MFEIIKFAAGPIATNAFLMFDTELKNAVVFDAPPDSWEIYKELLEKHQLKLDAILLTHSHWDHSADTALIKRATNADVYIHKDDEYRLLAPKENALMQLPFEIEPAKADYYLKDGDIISFARMNFKVLHTPGHTEGSVCFLNEDESIIVTGDTLFNGNVGRYDLPGGDGMKLKDSLLKKLMLLDDNLIVLNGHGENSSIGYERENNYFINGIFDIEK